MQYLEDRSSFFSAWLRVEMPRAHQEYEALLRVVREKTGALVAEAWGPPEPMSLSLEDKFAVDVSAEAGTFASAVRASTGIPPRRVRH